MSTELEVRRADVPDARADLLPTLFGTTEPAAIVTRMGEISSVLMKAIHDRQLSRRYGDNEREFLLIEAWQFLASMLSVSARVEWTKPLPDGSGWEARAVVVTIDGRELGSGEGMCCRTEAGRQRAPLNTLRQMSQIRARRSALRSVLGFVAAIGGLDLSDPDAPLTAGQRKALWAIAGELGWDRDEVHHHAGVDSLNDLDRTAAADLLDQWSALVEKDLHPPADDGQGTVSDEEHPDGGDDAAQPGTPPSSPGFDPDAPATAQQWTAAVIAFGSRVEALRAVSELRGGAGASIASVKSGELRQVIVSKTGGSR